MQRYFASDFQQELILDLETSKHITKVMRNKVGEVILICIDKTYYEFEIIKLDTNVTVKCVKKLDIDHENKIKTTLVIPILKKDNHKIAIQKAIELGVNEIILYQGDNTVVKWKDPVEKLKKLETFVVDACRQSFRNEICKLSFSKLKDIDLKKFDFLLFGDETLNTISKLELNCGDKVLFISGCEGGFSQIEYDFFNKNKIIPVSLAKTILRAETAPIAFQSAISFGNF